MTSTQGTSQGDPLAMTMYRIEIIPLIGLLQKPNVTQKWYADYGKTVGDFRGLRAILNNLVEHGKAFGYNVNTSKCQLIEKENRRESAIKVFEGANITMVDGFITSPRNAYSCYSKGLKRNKIFHPEQLWQLWKHLGK